MIKNVEFSESWKVKNDQQRQKVEAEYAARYLAEQRIASLDQALNLYEQKSQDSIRKYLNEIESVSFWLRCYCQIRLY